MGSTTHLGAIHMLTELCLAQAGVPAWLSSGTIGVSVFWICIAAICIVSSLNYYRHETEKVRVAAQLKQQMMEHGFSPAEMLAILKENPKLLPKESPSATVAPNKPAAQPSVYS